MLRRRVEQLQTELRVYRTKKFNQDTARRMEDLENDLSMMEIERDNLKNKLERAEQQLQLEAGSVKVRRALEIAAATAETSASLNDLLSSLRIEVMAAEGEFEQYAQNIPRASFELIRQSLKDARLALRRGPRAAPQAARSRRVSRRSPELDPIRSTREDRRSCGTRGHPDRSR